MSTLNQKKNKAIKILVGFCLLLLILPISLSSQNTFEFTIKDTSTDEIINDAIELPDVVFFFHVINFTPSLPGKLTLSD